MMTRRAAMHTAGLGAQIGVARLYPPAERRRRILTLREAKERLLARLEAEDRLSKGDAS